MAPGTAFFKDLILSSERVLMMTSFMMGLLSFSKLFLIIAWFKAQGSDCGGGFAAKKGSQPRLAALGSPFQGKGARMDTPSFL